MRLLKHLKLNPIVELKLIGLVCLCAGGLLLVTSNDVVTFFFQLIGLVCVAFSGYFYAHGQMIEGVVEK